VNRQLYVRPGREREFEELFTRRWKRLLLSSEGYLGTELKQEVGLAGVYRVVDIWQSHYDFEAFCWQQSGELKRFQEAVRADGIVIKETQLGAYYGPGDDLDDGTLTPA
jgi:heme-degrading monooxygenase HmoA